MKKTLYTFLLSIVIHFSALAQWTFTNYTFNTEIYSVHFIDDQIGYATGYHEVYKTANGGDLWTLISDYDFTNGPTGIWFMTESVGFIIGSDGGGNPQVGKTINGGTSWTMTTLPVSGMGFNDPNKMYFLDDNTGFIACRSGLIYKTINQGVDWTELTSGTTEDLSSIFFPSSTTGYVSKNYDNSILKTITGGSSWSPKNLGQTITVNDLFFTTNDIGYLACSNSTILKTIDGGTNWTSYSLGTSDAFYAIEFTSSEIGYAVGSSGIIVTTTNGGTSWNPILSGATQLLYCIDFPSSNVGYIGALNGGGPGKILKTINGGGIVSLDEQNDNLDFTLFPNPSNDKITITSKQDLTGTSYNIIDQLGRKIVSGIMTNETNSIDISQLESGIYSIQLNTGNTQLLKIIKN